MTLLTPSFVRSLAALKLASTKTEEFKNYFCIPKPDKDRHGSKYLFLLGLGCFLICFGYHEVLGKIRHISHRKKWVMFTIYQVLKNFQWGWNFSEIVYGRSFGVWPNSIFVSSFLHFSGEWIICGILSSNIHSMFRNFQIIICDSDFKPMLLLKVVLAKIEKRVN